jgi:hypothetical protein
MAFRIQRVPRGLNDLLSSFGGATPTELEDRVRGSLELLQLYGTTQLQAASANAPAAAEGASIALTLSNRWTVLFNAQGQVLKTATMTALRIAVSLNRNVQGGSALLFSDEGGPFGATESGFVRIGGQLPYPLLCPPGTALQTTLDILGTDASANISVVAEFGVLG